jgi:hypothetical protein
MMPDPSSTAVSMQPVSIANGDGTYSCATASGDVYAGCPAQWPRDGQPCSPRRIVCDYPGTDGYQSCSCLPTAAGDQWQCTGVGYGYDCPVAQPADGSSCGSNDFGKQCDYLRPLPCTCDADRNVATRRAIVCSCTKAASAWSCASDGAGGAPGSGPFDEAACFGPEPPLPARPALDESKLIKDLTDDEVATWCNWFMNNNRGDGPPPPSQPPMVDSHGIPSGWGFTSCGQMPATCVSMVPVSYCEQLMRYGSCDAPLGSLDDCYLTFFNHCEVVGNGCEDMGGRPSCRQTVVQLGAADSTTCPPLPVKWSSP